MSVPWFLLMVDRGSVGNQAPAKFGSAAELDRQIESLGVWGGLNHAEEHLVVTWFGILVEIGGPR